MERDIRKYIFWLNDRIHNRTFVSYDDLADNLKMFKVKIYDCIVPAIINYPFVEGKNYYQEWLNIKTDYFS